MKTVKQTLDKYTDQEILHRLFEIYPDQKESEAGYWNAMAEMRALKPGKSRLMLQTGKYDVTGFEQGDDTRWGIGFMDWKDLMACRVKRSTLDSICNILWEATYHGYSQRQNRKFRKDMLKRVKDIEDQHSNQ